MNLLYSSLQLIVLDGYQSSTRNSSVPTEKNFQRELKDVQAVIIPFTSSQDVAQYYVLCQSLGIKILGYRISVNETDNPRVAVQRAIGYLKSKDMLNKKHIVWMDQRRTYTEDCVKNQHVASEMFDELTMHLGGPQYLGVFTKKAVWTERFCDLKKWAHIKLWYSNANEKPTFGDYLRFGGWIDPYAKQYSQGKVTEGDDLYKYSLTFIKDE